MDYAMQKFWKQKVNSGRLQKAILKQQRIYSTIGRGWTWSPEHGRCHEEEKEMNVGVEYVHR
jgi:hypothetical protein